MTTVVTGVCADVAAAEAAVGELVAAGFPRPSISVIVKSTPDHEKLLLAETDDVPRGAITGAVSGGALASLAFASLALPGIGILATGPLIAALVAGTTGAVAGGLLGALTAHGVGSMAAEEYENAIARGKAVVAVHTVHERLALARRVLTAAGARQVSDSVHFSGPAGQDAED